MTIFIAKCNLAFCQLEFPFPVRLYTKVILYGVVYPSMYTHGYVHVHVCVCVCGHACSHIDETLFTYTFYGVTEGAIFKNHHWNWVEFLRHFKEWHFTDTCCPSIQTPLERCVTTSLQRMNFYWLLPRLLIKNSHNGGGGDQFC